MKCFITLLIIVVTSYIGFAQDKIEGIGKFKIGKTNVTTMEEIAKETGDKISIMDEYLNMGSEQFRVGEIIINKTYPDRSPEEASFCPGVRIFQIPKLDVANIPIRDLFLTFKDGVLVGIRCLGSKEISDAITLKYGKPIIKTEKKKVNCVYMNNGNKLSLEESKFTNTWLNGRIVAIDILHKYYSEHCDEQFEQKLSIEDQAMMNTITRYDIAKKLNTEANKQSDKKKSLKDF